VKYCSNRKEAKDHGEGGNLLGHVLEDGDRVVMVEDVTTSGKSIDETYPLITGAANIEVKGLMVSLNRMEVGKGGVTTAQKEIEAKYGFPVASIVSMAEVVETLYNHEIDGKVVIDDELKTAIDAYYEQYGVR
ncbi:MAG: orotate phosphoribosyltransferase, partial [Collinsella sp.]|nr:orotate phosphoribosyltransferase [Collinsella sp.]